MSGGREWVECGEGGVGWLEVGADIIGGGGGELVRLRGGDWVCGWFVCFGLS